MTGLFNFKMLMMMLTATLGLALAAPAMATGSGGGGVSANAGANAGAKATVNTGNTWGLPGSTAIGGATGVDTDTFWIFGRSRPNLCHEVKDTIAFNQRLGVPYSPSQVRSALEQACRIETKAAPVPMMVQEDKYVGGKAGPSKKATESSAMMPASTSEPVEFSFNGMKYRITNPAHIQKWNNCEPMTMKDIGRVRAPGCGN